MNDTIDQTVSPQACSTCADASGGAPGESQPVSYVYAIGRIEPRFPSLSVEKEFAQATARSETKGLTDRQKRSTPC
jgi:hypothetical protein